MKEKRVLDHGYVRLLDVMGGDLDVVNAAKVSFDKRSEEMGQREGDLMEFLANAKPTPHTSPYRHAVLKFEVSAPMIVKNQWYKYVIGSDHDDKAFRDPFFAWNEISRRYVADSLEFYVPKLREWRVQARDKKQGSDGLLVDQHDGAERAGRLMDALQQHIDQGKELFEKAVNAGVAVEQARLFLPGYAVYVKWIWTASLQAVCHLLTQRLAPDAQYEFQLYARAVEELTAQHFPEAVKNLVKRYPAKVWRVKYFEGDKLKTRLFTRRKDALRFWWNAKDSIGYVESEELH